LLKETGRAAIVSPNVSSNDTASVASITSPGTRPATSLPKVPLVFEPSRAAPRMVPIEHMTIEPRPEMLPDPLSFPTRIELLFQPKTNVRVPARRTRISSIALRD